MTTAWHTQKEVRYGCCDKTTNVCKRNAIPIRPDATLDKDLDCFHKENGKWAAHNWYPRPRRNRPGDPRGRTSNFGAATARGRTIRRRNFGVAIAHGRTIRRRDFPCLVDSPPRTLRGAAAAE